MAISHKIDEKCLLALFLNYLRSGKVIEILLSYETSCHTVLCNIAIHLVMLVISCMQFLLVIK